MPIIIMAFFTRVLLLDVFAIITTLVAIGYVYFKWSYQYWKRRNVPYFEPKIPFGTQNPFNRRIGFAENYKLIYNKVKAKGWKHCGLYIITSPVYFVVDLDLLKNIMVKHFQHFLDRGTYTNDRDDPINSHLFHLGGVKWRNLRAKLSPAFTSGKLKAMFQTLVDCGLVLEKYFEEDIENRTVVDIKDMLARFTTDVIGSCAFGLNCNSFKDPDSPFRLYGKRSQQITKLEALKIGLAASYPNVARAFRICRTRKDVRDFFTKVVEDTVTYREKNNFTRKDFLQLLIDLRSNKDSQEEGYEGDGKTLTMREIVAQSYVFFTGGFETSSTTMTFALFQLATHPEIQEKVRKEIEVVLAKHDDHITYDSLSELKYLGQVIDETLRLYPPVPIIPRMCVEDYKVPGEDVIIKKGTRVFISVMGIHHDEEYYKNPEVFDPERFNEKNKEQRHPYAHIPFGEGPRLCIGQRFGLMQVKVGLTCILRKFKVSLNEKTKLPLEISRKSFVLSVDGGIWLNFEKL